MKKLKILVMLVVGKKPLVFLNLVTGDTALLSLLEKREALDRIIHPICFFLAEVFIL